MFLSDKRAFTLVEMLVSVFILLTITTLMLANFREGEKRIRLMAATNILASDIRKVQNMVINGSKFGNIEMTTGGYGIYFPSSNKEYVIFADNNLNRVFDWGEGLATTTLNSIIISLPLEGSDPLRNLVFNPPRAQICENIDSCASCDCSIKNAGVYDISLINDIIHTSMVRINQVSGRVEVR